MTTRYQLEICNPVSGEWVPHGKPARTMTAAHLYGLRLYPEKDLRVVPIEVDDDSHEIEQARRNGWLGGVRQTTIDGQSVTATSGVSDDMIRDEIAKRRLEKQDD